MSSYSRPVTSVNMAPSAKSPPLRLSAFTRSAPGVPRTVILTEAIQLVVR